MTRKKGKKELDFTVQQEVVRTGVKLKSFDLMLRFTKGTVQPELFMDELVKQLLDGLLDRYGQIIVKVNWWDNDLTVIAPNEIPANSTQQDALQGT